MTDEEFEAAGKLRWIQSPSAGVEWMWKIPASPTRTCRSRTRAAPTPRRSPSTPSPCCWPTPAPIKLHYDYQAKHQWVRGDMSRHLSGIKGLTMGIIGFGNIGRNIGRRAAAFEMDVLAVDAHPGQPGDGAKEVWPLER